MIRLILFFTFLISSLTQVYCQDSIPIINEVKAGLNPLDTLNFDEIIAYNINYDSINNKRTHFQMSYNAGEYDLSPRYASSKKNIDTTLFKRIITLFSDTTTYGDNYADCFDPRFVLQFKYENEERFRIVICQGCGFLVSTVPIPAAYLKYYDNQYEKEGGQVIYRRYLKGFSVEGTKKINDLCNKLKMGYCEN
jgi:hypothetical protein